MRDIRRLKRECIGANGTYADFERMEIFTLTAEEIYYLRQYYKDDSIAKNIYITVTKKEKANENPRPKEEPVRSNPSVKNRQRTINNDKRKVQPKYVVDRKQPYTGRKHNLPKKLKRELTTFLLIGTIGMSVITGGYLFNELFDKDGVKLGSEPGYGAMFDDKDVSIIIGDQYQATVPNYADNDSSIIDEISNRKEIIRKLCDIYQVNYDIVYSTLNKVTDNFTSMEYLTYSIDDVTCKGFNVQADSEEAYLIYMVRIIKQDPDRWNVDKTNLYINNGYTSGNNYCEQIEYVADTLGIDKYLMYAIVQSECGFNSELFNNGNNPGGIISNNGEWWRFETKLEGFIELGLEIQKYYKMIGKPTTMVDEETVVEIRDIHAPLSDGNENWLPNVLDNIEYAHNNSVYLFGISQNKGIRH